MSEKWQLIMKQGDEEVDPQFWEQLTDVYLRCPALYKKGVGRMKQQRQQSYRTISQELGLNVDPMRVYSLTKRYKKYVKTQLFKFRTPQGELPKSALMKVPAWMRRTAIALDIIGEYKMTRRKTPSRVPLSVPWVVERVVGRAREERALNSRTVTAHIDRLANDVVRHVWEGVQSIVKQKLKYLISTGDHLLYTDSTLGLTTQDWDVLDLMLLYTDDEHVLVNDDSWSIKEQCNTLYILFHLVRRHQLEPRGDALAWSRAHHTYTRNRTEVSVVLLQRRWHEAKLHTRTRALTHAHTLTALQAQILHTYPHIVTHPLSPWRELVSLETVHTGLVKVEPTFDEDYVIPPPDDNNDTNTDDDIILIEKEIETVEIEDDDSCDDEPRLIIAETDNTTDIKPEPEDNTTKDTALDINKDPENFRNQVKEKTRNVCEKIAEELEKEIKEVSDDGVAGIEVLETLDPDNVKTTLIFDSDSDSDDDDDRLKIEIEITPNIDSEVIEDNKHFEINKTKILDSNTRSIKIFNGLTKNESKESKIDAKLEDIKTNDFESSIIDDITIEENKLDVVNVGASVARDVTRPERLSEERYKKLMRLNKADEESIDPKLLMRTTIKLVRVDSTKFWIKYSSDGRIDIKYINNVELTPTDIPVIFKDYGIVNRCQSSAFRSIMESALVAGDIPEYTRDGLLVEMTRDMQGSSDEDDTPLKTYKGKNNDVRDVMDPDELKKLLNKLSVKSNKATSIYQFCCIARKHRILSDARRRIAHRAGRPAPYVNLHDADRHVNSCQCCCRHLLEPSDADLAKDIQREQRWLNTLIKQRDKLDRLNNIEDEKKKRLRRRNSSKNTEETKPAESNEEDGYTEWLRQKTLNAQYFGLNNTKKKTQVDAQTESHVTPSVPPTPPVTQVPPVTHVPSLIDSPTTTIPTTPNNQYVKTATIINHIVPHVIKVKPHVPQANPRLPQTTPHVPQAAPQGTQATPHVPHVKPHVPQVTPHVTQATPQVTQDTPHMPQATPHMPQATPQRTQATPQVTQTTPHVPQAKPHVPQATPHVPQATPHVPQATQHVAITHTPVVDTSSLIKCNTIEEGEQPHKKPRFTNDLKRTKTDSDTDIECADDTNDDVSTSEANVQDDSDDVKVIETRLPISTVKVYKAVNSEHTIAMTSLLKNTIDNMRVASGPATSSLAPPPPSLAPPPPSLAPLPPTLTSIPPSGSWPLLTIGPPPPKPVASQSPTNIQCSGNVKKNRSFQGNMIPVKILNNIPKNSVEIVAKSKASVKPKPAADQVVITPVANMQLTRVEPSRKVLPVVKLPRYRSGLQVGAYLAERDPTSLHLLCADQRYPLLLLAGEYVLVTPEPVDEAILRAAFYTMDGKRNWKMVHLNPGGHGDEGASGGEGGASLRAMLVNERVCFSRKVYRKLKSDPLIFAQIHTAMSPSYWRVTCERASVELWNIRTGAIHPVTKYNNAGLHCDQIAPLAELVSLLNLKTELTYSFLMEAKEEGQEAKEGGQGDKGSVSVPSDLATLQPLNEVIELDSDDD